MRETRTIGVCNFRFWSFTLLSSSLSLVPSMIFTNEASDFLTCFPNYEIGQDEMHHDTDTWRPVTAASQAAGRSKVR